MTKSIIIIIFFFAILSCTHTNTIEFTNAIDNDTVAVKSMQIKYAKGFTVDYFNTYKKITVFNPWKNNSVFWEYFIVTDSMQLKPNKEGKFYILNNSLNKVLQLSGTQISMFEQLNGLDKIKAIGEKKYLYNKKVLKSIEESKVIELGNEQNINSEKLISDKINAVFTTGWGKVNNNFLKISSVGIPIIYSLDWQEQSPLARAEWIKFISCFYNKETQAEEYFNKIEKKYLDLKHIAKTTNEKPKVFNGNSISGTWYVAGSKSYLVKLFNDANAEYIFNDNNSTGSVPLSFETVYSKALHADFWIASGNADFKASDERYKMFKAYQKNNIYINNNRINNVGGNDYWETGVIRPDLQLKDFINIFHKNILPDTSLVYYKRVN